MVLDVKAMTWAASHGIDTAKLKAAKVPIYGKWYFPELPANVNLVNLATGERARYPLPMLAGEVLWVAERDLKRAGLSPLADEPAEPDLDHPLSPHAIADAPEPMFAMARPPVPVRHEPVPFETLPAVVRPLPPMEHDPAEAAGIHLPLASISPLVLGVGVSLALVGVITHPLMLLVGLIWTLIGAVGWIRIGLLESRAASHQAHH